MYTDLLARIKNTALAKKASLTAPFSKGDFAIAKILMEEGYLTSVEKRATNKRQFIEATLAYKDGAPVFTDFRFVSKPSRHIYMGYGEFRPVRQNFGTAVVSTSKGVMTAKTARKEKVGGEYLFDIW